MESLNTRQMEIAGLAALGLSNDEIAARLGLSSNLVRSELKDIYRELKVPVGEADATETSPEERMR